jgi:hypothetical protein
VILRLDSHGRASWRPIPRPPVGDDPMMWKERYSSRVGGIAKMLGLLNNLFWVTLIAVLTFEYARTAIAEFLGLSTWGGNGDQNRRDFNAMIRGISPWVAGFWILGTASTAASSIASEREDDTWISLIATDLEGKEILRAKMIGSILRFRWMGLTLLTVWILGVLGGAVHIGGLLAAMLELSVFLWFAAALGIRFSLLSSSTSRALMMTMGWLLFLNGGYLLCCIPMQIPSVVTCRLGVMTFLLRDSLFSSMDLATFDAFLNGPLSSEIRHWSAQPVTPSVLGVLMYELAASVLTWRTFARFDSVVDRPTLAMRAEDAPASANGASKEKTPREW